MFTILIIIIIIDCKKLHQRPEKSFTFKKVTIDAGEFSFILLNTKKKRKKKETKERKDNLLNVGTVFSLQNDTNESYVNFPTFILGERHTHVPQRNGLLSKMCVYTK